MDWPNSVESLIDAQTRLAQAVPEPWQPPEGTLAIGACWVCFRRGASGPGAAGDPVRAAATVMGGRSILDRHVQTGSSDAPYVPGLMAMRIGRIMEETVRGLTMRPDLLVVDATSRDHPRRAGLALHIGAALDLPSVGVTHRPLVAKGDWPGEERGATSPLVIDGTVVGAWLRTRAGTRPLAVHPGWRISLDDAMEVVMRTTWRHRTPEPLRRARQHARLARAEDGG